MGTYRFLLLGGIAFSMLANKPENFEISDGSRITVDNKGFSISPPKGWEVYRDYPKLSLLMQIAYSKDLEYQRTIQIASFQGPAYIDDITAREFGKTIVSKYSKVSDSIADYKLRNHMLTKMENGDDGILFYTQFKIDEKDMMQAHILVSSSKNHYLLSFTDLKSHFEGEEASPYLTEAWQAMTSVRLRDSAPIRFQKPVLLGLGVITILIVAILIYLIRHAKASRRYTDHTKRDDVITMDGDLPPEASFHPGSKTPGSEHGWHVSDLPPKAPDKSDIEKRKNRDSDDEVWK